MHNHNEIPFDRKIITAISEGQEAVLPELSKDTPISADLVDRIMAPIDTAVSANIQHVIRVLRQWVHDRMNALLEQQATLDQLQELEVILNGMHSARRPLARAWFARYQDQTRLSYCLRDDVLKALVFANQNFQWLCHHKTLAGVLPKLAAQWQASQTVHTDEDVQAWIAHKKRTLTLADHPTAFANQVKDRWMARNMTDLVKDYDQLRADYIDLQEDGVRAKIELAPYENPHRMAFRLMGLGQADRERRMIINMMVMKVRQGYHQCLMSLCLDHHRVDWVKALIMAGWPLNEQRISRSWSYFLATGDAYRVLIQNNDIATAYAALEQGRTDQSFANDLTDVFNQGAWSVIHYPKGVKDPIKVGVLWHLSSMGEGCKDQYNQLARDLVDQPKTLLSATAQHPRVELGVRKDQFNKQKSRLLGRWCLHSLIYIALSLLLPVAIAFIAGQVLGLGIMSVCFKIGLVCAAIALACRIPMAYDIHAFDFAEASQPLPGRALEGDEMIEGPEAFRRVLDQVDGLVVSGP